MFPMIVNYRLVHWRKVARINQVLCALAKVILLSATWLIKPGSCFPSIHLEGFEYLIGV